MSESAVESLGAESIHYAFGLSYASYLVVPRSILQEMPGEWQEKFVALMRELNDRLPWEDEMDDRGVHYTVGCRDEKGRMAHDPYRQYRHSHWGPEDFVRP